MYATHQPTISRYARASADNLARVMQFVILTARQPLFRVTADMETAEQGGEDAMSVLFGWKFSAYNSVMDNRNRHFSFLEHVAESGDTNRQKLEAMLEYIADLPGFGPAKAGFVTQLAYGLGGCIDTHNLRRFNLPERGFDNYCQRKTTQAKRRMISRYIDTLEQIGSPQFLWDSWCAYVANRRPNVYRNPFQVSALHCRALGLPEE